MTLRTYFLGWTMNMRLSAKSIRVMLTDDYSYTSLGYLIFIIQLEKNLAKFICKFGNDALPDAGDRNFFAINYLPTY